MSLRVPRVAGSLIADQPEIVKVGTMVWRATSKFFWGYRNTNNWENINNLSCYLSKFNSHTTTDATSNFDNQVWPFLLILKLK